MKAEERPPDLGPRRIPVLDITELTPQGPRRCRTCTAGAEGSRLLGVTPCKTDIPALRLKLQKNGTLVTGGSGTVAIVETCGYEPARKCLACALFIPINHHEYTPSKFPSGQINNLNKDEQGYQREIRVAGYCAIPDEGFTDPETGKRVHCVQPGPGFLPKIPDIQPSCGNCEYLVIPGGNDFWRTGLMATETEVVRVGAGPYKEQVINRKRPGGGKKWRRIRLRQALSRVEATDEAGLTSTYRASVKKLNQPPGLSTRMTVRFTGGNRDVGFFIGADGQVLSFAVKVPHTKEPRRVLVARKVPPGQITVRPSAEDPDLVFVEMALKPYRKLFGIPRKRTSMKFPPEPDLRLPLRVVQKPGGEWLVETSQGTQPHPTILRQRFRSLVNEARTLGGAGAVRGVYQTWTRVTHGLMRQEVAEPWSFPPVPGVERGMPVCMRWVANAGGLDLRVELGWRRFGDPQWDNDVSKDIRKSPRSTTMHKMNSFDEADNWDHWRAFDQGARVAEAVDAALIAGGLYNRRTGCMNEIPAIATAWQEPVRYDLFNETVTDNWLHDEYDEAHDKAMYLEVLAEMTEDEDGVPCSNRYRRHGYELSPLAHQPMITVYDRSDVEDDEDDEDDEIDLTDSYAERIRNLNEEDEEEPESEMYDRTEEAEQASDGGEFIRLRPQDPDFDLYCTSCREIFATTGAVLGLGCPKCGMPGFIVGERDEPPGEKAKHVSRWRSSPGMVRKGQLAETCCEGWVYEGSGRSWQTTDGSWSDSERRRLDLTDFEARDARIRKYRSSLRSATQ